MRRLDAKFEYYRFPVGAFSQREEFEEQILSVKSSERRIIQHLILDDVTRLQQESPYNSTHMR